MDFLLVIMELFSLGVTAEKLGANIDWESAFLKGVGRFCPKYQVKEVFHLPYGLPSTIFRVGKPDALIFDMV